MARERDHTPAVRSISEPPSLEGGRYLVGYAAKFNRESEVLYDFDVTDEDGTPIPFIEVIDPGAFTRTLRETPDIKALVNHDTAKVLGSTAARTADLSADAVGLAFKVDVPDTSYGRDSKVSVGRGDIRGCSFRFYTIKDRIEIRQGKPALRTLLDVDIDEISPVVTFPAYGDTEVQVRAKAKGKAAPMSPVARHEYERRRLELLSL